MYFTLLVQENSLESWKDKLPLDKNIPTRIVVVDLNVSSSTIFKLTAQNQVTKDSNV